MTVAVDRSVQVRPPAADLQVGLILSAKSGRLGEGGEACHPRSGAWQSIEPVYYPHNVHPDSGADLLECCFCQSNVTAPAHSEGAHALRQRALHSGPSVIALLPRGIIHP